jgi:hypothetical protein
MADVDIADLDETLVYHEQQTSALCGRHALNNLLQVPMHMRAAAPAVKTYKLVSAGSLCGRICVG